MFVRARVCMCMCMCVRESEWVRECVSEWVRECVCVCARQRVRVWLCVCVRVSLCLCPCLCPYLCVHLRLRLCHCLCLCHVSVCIIDLKHSYNYIRTNSLKQTIWCRHVQNCDNLPWWVRWVQHKTCDSIYNDGHADICNTDGKINIWIMSCIKDYQNNHRFIHM